MGGQWSYFCSSAALSSVSRASFVHSAAKLQPAVFDRAYCRPSQLETHFGLRVVVLRQKSEGGRVGQAQSHCRVTYSTSDAPSNNTTATVATTVIARKALSIRLIPAPSYRGRRWVKQKDWMAALISITTGNLSQASAHHCPIMAKRKPLAIMRPRANDARFS